MLRQASTALLQIPDPASSSKNQQTTGSNQRIRPHMTALMGGQSATSEPHIMLVIGAWRLVAYAPGIVHQTGICSDICE
jgi:hypothetical protein